MRLNKIAIQGLKCFKDLTEISFNDLTILIGENDAGKSSILHSLQYLLTKSTPSHEEYCKIETFEADQITIEGLFTHERPPEEIKKYFIGDDLKLKKVYTKNNPNVLVSIEYDSFTDDELENYQNLPAPTTQELLRRYNLQAVSNQAERKEIIKNYIDINHDSLPKSRGYNEINVNQISQYLPIFEYYSSSDYGNPKNLVSKTLNTIYRAYFYDDEGHLKLKSFKELENRLTSKLNLQIKKNLLVNIQKYNPKVIDVNGNFSIDFSRGFALDGLSLDEGKGYNSVDQKGEGSKKRLFLSILEWDKEVQRDLGGHSIIRAYDEPDSNLHFDAQRKMFYSIKEVSENKALKIQGVIATHSISMIDRAPAKSINHIKYNSGSSSVEYLQTDGDDDMRKFLEEISEISGIKNSSIFYEKCFLIVEGDSEENAIPKMYKTYYGKSLIEDGVVLINIQSNGAWKNFLKLLNRNKSNSTVVLLDNDTNDSLSTANVTPAKLTEIGFPASFLTNNIFFAGSQEFEDLFPDKKIRTLFNKLYPRSTKGKWGLSHIHKMRTDYSKLSKGFYDYSKRFIQDHKKIYKKPEFASEMADILTKEEIESMIVIHKLFIKIREIIE